MLFSKIVIFLPLMLVMFLDATFTVFGQPNIYWDNYSSCSEGSPVGRVFLSMGPEIFVLSFSIYVLAAYALIKRLQNPFDSMVTIMLFLGHSWGSASWLEGLIARLLSFELSRWYLHVIYFMLVSAICGICSWNLGRHPAKEKS